MVEGGWRVSACLPVVTEDIYMSLCMDSSTTKSRLGPKNGNLPQSSKSDHWAQSVAQWEESQEKSMFDTKQRICRRIGTLLVNTNAQVIFFKWDPREFWKQNYFPLCERNILLHPKKQPRKREELPALSSVIPLGFWELQAWIAVSVDYLDWLAFVQSHQSQDICKCWR